MNRKQLQKQGYNLIVKQRLSHQIAFDKLLGMNEGKHSADTVATELSRIPSRAKSVRFQSWITAYVAVLVVVLFLRSLVLVSLFQSGMVSETNFVLGLLLSFFFPLLGIYGALTSRIQIYRTVLIICILLLLKIIRLDGHQPLLYLFLEMLPFLSLIYLSYAIPQKLRTPYEKTTVKIEDIPNHTENHVYLFERDDYILENELLDDGL